MRASPIARSALAWLRGDGVDLRTTKSRWGIVFLALALSFSTYPALVDSAKARRIDRENVQVVGTVVDVVQYQYTDRFGGECSLRVLVRFKQKDASSEYYVGERTPDVGARYATVGPCATTPFIALGAPIPVEYAAGDPRISRLHSATSAVDANLTPLVFALLWLLLGGLIVVDRSGKKLFDW